MMNINELTVGQVKEIAAMVESSCADTGPYQVGKAVLIRTVTHYYTGRIASVYARELVIEEAAWIADTGRFGTALKSGGLSEVEPMPGPVIVNRSAIIDCAEWSHNLPKEQK